MTSRKGRPYHVMTWNGSGDSRERSVPIFGNEIPWLLDSLRVLVRDLSFAGVSETGTYPMVSHLGAAGGLAWEVEHQEGTGTLTLRRFKNSIWREGESYYTRYLVPTRSGRSPQKAPMAGDFVDGGGLEDFTTELVSKASQIREHLLGTLRQIPGDGFDPFKQAVVDGTLADYTTESLADAICLDQPVGRICLDLCEEEQNAQELSNRIPLGARDISHVLGWTQRYAPTVLADAFLFSPRSERSGETYLAVRQRDLFRSDPLLSCLDTSFRSEERVSGDGDWLNAPQCKATGFQRAIDSGLADGVFATAWGRAPIPEVEEAGKLRSFVRMHPSMRKHRYRILQLAWRASAEINNLAGGISRDPVLCYQRLALMRFDVDTLFEERPSPLLDEMRARMYAALEGNTQATTIDEWEDLPRQGEP